MADFAVQKQDALGKYYAVYSETIRPTKIQKNDYFMIIVKETCETENNSNMM